MTVDATLDAVPRSRNYLANLITADGYTETSFVISARNDNAALFQVERLAASYTVEVWEHGRPVAKLPMHTG